jgi:hypothetical protein
MEDLPEELRLRILQDLSCSDLCKFRTLNSSWKELSDDETLWQKLVQRDFCFFVDPSLPEDKSWKAYYQFLKANAWSFKAAVSHPQIKVVDNGFRVELTADGISVGRSDFSVNTQKISRFDVTIEHLAPGSKIGVGLATGVLNNLLFQLFFFFLLFLSFFLFPFFFFFLFFSSNK